MSCTYDPDLKDDVSWVRRLIGDVDVPNNCLLEDEEIQAFIDEESAFSGNGPWVKYCAASLAWDALIVAGATSSSSTFGRIVEKQVGRLRLRRSEGATTRDLARSFGDYLRGRCSWLKTPRSRAFAVMGTPCCGRRGRRIIGGS